MEEYRRSLGDEQRGVSALELVENETCLSWLLLALLLPWSCECPIFKIFALALNIPGRAGKEGGDIQVCTWSLHRSFFMKSNGKCVLEVVEYMTMAGMWNPL